MEIYSHVAKQRVRAATVLTLDVNAPLTARCELPSAIDRLGGFMEMSRKNTRTQISLHKVCETAYGSLLGSGYEMSGTENQLELPHLFASSVSVVRKEAINMRQEKIEKPEKLTFSDSVIYEGDALTVLRRLPDCSVQSIITSPPYWGLRDYSIPDQLGLEGTFAQYLNALRTIFSEIRRVLKSDGIFWLNIGDGYTSGNRGWRAPDKKNPARAMSVRPDTPDGLKPKDLLGVPWRLAFALQDDGWYLRADIIWNKPNAMPESVKDRPTRAHEYLFMFTKGEQYWYDRDAIMEANGTGKRNRRSVWNIHTQAFPGAHFATFPPALVEPCIIAATRPGDFILDPFFGAGTAGLVAQRLNRKYVGIELHPAYVKLAAERLNANERAVIRVAA